MSYIDTVRQSSLACRFQPAGGVNLPFTCRLKPARRGTSNRLFIRIGLMGSMAMASAALAQSTMPATNQSTAPSTTPGSMPVEATTQPTTSPATLPSTMPANPPSTSTSAPVDPRIKLLTKDYGIFTTRSLFMKGHVAPPSLPNNTSPPPPPPPQVTNSDRNIVFDGATDADGEIVAMFEDTQAGKIIQCRVGDSLAGGRVTAVSLDSVTYESNGRKCVITLGQTLDASEAPLLTSRATITDNGNGNPATTAPADPNDVLEKLKAKRRKELGQ